MSLADLHGLQRLSFDDTVIGDLTPLAHLASLQVLSFDRTAVGDLGPLRGLVGLRTLYCSGTQVADLAPLAGLKWLTLDGTQVEPDDSIVAALRAREVSVSI